MGTGEVCVGWTAGRSLGSESLLESSKCIISDILANFSSTEVIFRFKPSV
jgi:hypothetical protein